MKIFKSAVVVFLICLIAAGCSKKTEEMTGVSGLGLEGESKDEITQTITSPEAEQPPVVSQPQPIQVEAKIEQNMQAVPLASDEIERNKQIQTALKNANLYFGEIDGKIGVLTRKAIEEFQKASGLQVDGKVGPKTWAVLSQYLNPAPAPTTTAKEKSTLKNR